MSHLIFYAHEYKGAEKLKANVASVNLLLMPSSHINDGIRLYFAFRVYCLSSFCTGPALIALFLRNGTRLAF